MLGWKVFVFKTVSTLILDNLDSFDYKTAVSAANATNFSTMAKIVDYMKVSFICFYNQFRNVI